MSAGGKGRCSVRKRARSDANQTSIVKALRQCGATVEVLSSLGHGVPDLLCAPKTGPMVLMEVKNGDLPPSGQKLTPDEAEWIDAWNSRVFIVRNVAEALAAIGVE
jgi:hypothetical protein